MTYIFEAGVHLPAIIQAALKVFHESCVGDGKDAQKRYAGDDEMILGEGINHLDHLALMFIQSDLALVYGLVYLIKAIWEEALHTELFDVGLINSREGLFWLNIYKASQLLREKWGDWVLVCFSTLYKSYRQGRNRRKLLIKVIKDQHRRQISYLKVSYTCDIYLGHLYPATQA